MIAPPASSSLPAAAPGDGSEDRLSATFFALADPTRRAILKRLADGERTVTELAEPFAMSLPAITKHLKVLERARLITRGRNAQFRPCALAPAPLHEATDWLSLYRKHWEDSFDRLGDYLATLKDDVARAPAPAPVTPATPARPRKKPKEKKT
ncbi:MAG: metalloregulator ArsR/SmtB family transcription factor [Byssovorax sp.]